MTDNNGHRIVICRPPICRGKGNPVTRTSNLEQGIKWEGKAVLVPRIFPTSAKVRAAADSVLQGRTLYLAQDFDGAAWNILETASDVLGQLAQDGNLLQLPPGHNWGLQLIFDGHGFTSRIGALRFVLRCTHSITDHNTRRCGRDPIFIMGTDKHGDLEKAVHIGGDSSLHARMYLGLNITVQDPSTMPPHVQQDVDYLVYACVACAIVLDVPRWGPADLTESGDCGAANASFAINSPVYIKGACLRCCAPKTDWIDALKLALVRKRNFFYQCYSNHVVPGEALAKLIAHLKTLEGKAGYAWVRDFLKQVKNLKCPHCGILVTKELMATDAKEMLEATPLRQKEIIKVHSATHAAAMRGLLPTAPLDQDYRSRGLLHRRMNIASNNLSATFLKVLFDSRKRILANKLLALHKMMWRFPETAKKRAKSIKAGNDSRILLSDKALLIGLFYIFYDVDGEEACKLLEALGDAADANVAVRNEKPHEVQKPNEVELIPKRHNKKGKMTPRAVAGFSGRKVLHDDLATYRESRNHADQNVNAAPNLAISKKPRRPAARSELRAPPRMPALDASSTPFNEGVGDVDDVPHTDRSCDLSDSEMERDEDLDEDIEAGGLVSAIDVWLTSIHYTAALHATYKDHFNLDLRRAHAKKCGVTGKAWAISINLHTSNRAYWQYVHDAFWHVEDDVLRHGTGDRNDDSLLEKENRRKKRLGDRVTFRGGTNVNGAQWRKTIRVLERDAKGKKTGRYRSKVIFVKAVIGVAAQCQRLDMIAHILQGSRASASNSLSAKVKEKKEEAKAVRNINRADTLQVLEELALEALEAERQNLTQMDA